MTAPITVIHVYEDARVLCAHAPSLLYFPFQLMKDAFRFFLFRAAKHRHRRLNKPPLDKVVLL